MDTSKIWHLRAIDAAELDNLYGSHIEADFPSQERPSLSALRRHVREGLQEVLLLSDGKEDWAYASVAEANGIAFITLLAVFPEMRGGGIGSLLMELLKVRYADRRALLLETEDPKHAKGAADLSIRLRRIAFYEKRGCALLQGISHTSIGVPLNLMALPLTDSLPEVQASVVDDVQTIYHKIMPEWLWERVITYRTE